MSGQLVTVCHGAPGTPVVLAIPYAGGSAQSFFAWKPLLAGRLSLLALELPGRGRCYGQERPASLLQLADGLATTLERGGVAPDAIYGHSFGALIAFELLRALRRRSAPLPALAAVSGRIAPSRPPRFGLPKLEPGDLLEYLRELGGTPDSALRNPQLMDLALPILKHDLELICGYDYHRAEPLPMDVIAMGGLNDERVPVGGLAGWADEFTGTFELRLYPGGHFYVESHREAVVETLCTLAVAAAGRDRCRA